MSSQHGTRLVLKVGMVLLTFHPISSSAGKYPQANGVDLYSNSPFVGSFSFLRSDLVAFTAHSTSKIFRL